MATATTIQQGVHPLLVTLFVIGLGIYPSNQPKPCLSVLYSLTIWCVYGCFYCSALFFFKWKTIFKRTINIISNGINISTTFTSVIIGLCYDKKLRMCIKKLAIVDDTLEELGTPKVYQEMHVWSKRTVIAWIIYILIQNIFDTYWWFNKKDFHLMTYLIPIVLNYCFYVNLFMDLVFIFFMRYVGTRFDKLNEHIQDLLVREEHGLRCTWKKPVIAVYRHTLCTDNRKRVLWTSMHLHLELCRIAREINLMFGTQMTLEMLTYLFFLTSVAFYGCIMVLVRKDISIKYWLSIVMRGSVCITRFYSVNYVCERVSVKANKINEILHQLTSILRYADIHQEICQFILQTMHHPLKFTGLGLFCFGSKLIWKFFAVITTFVMLFAQWSPELQEYSNLQLKMNNYTGASKHLN